MESRTSTKRPLLQVNASRTTHTHDPTEPKDSRDKVGGYALQTLPAPHRSQVLPELDANGHPKPDQRGPRFIARSTEDKHGTEVDVVLVPCPGADPLKTWTGEGGRQLWATEGIRKQASSARVLTYDHGYVKEKWTLKSLATDLLQVLFEERSLRNNLDRDRKRPLFFICHSIGGLVVKLALTEAGRHNLYRPIVDFCHGVTFFATPHHGSIHLFMDDFKSSIQEVLDLRAPLPASLTTQLNLDDRTLQTIDKNFKQLSGEFKLWTFYETEDSLLCPSRESSGPKGIHYTAPITPMRSAILGVKHEKIYARRSTHAECAWFEFQDRRTLQLYLDDLCDAILKAANIQRQDPTTALYQPLNSKVLESKVSIEVHAFYEDKITEAAKPGVQILFIKQSLEEFLRWGPDALLNQRLVNRQRLGLDYGPMVGQGLTIGRTVVWRDPELDEDELLPGGSRPPESQFLIRRDRAQSLLRPFEWARARETGRISTTTTEPGTETPSPVPSEPGTETPSPMPQQERVGATPTVLDASSGDRKKFEWIHVPFNNPIWVEKVFETLSVNDKTSYAELFSAPHWGSRHTRARHPQHHACFLKPTCGTISFEEASVQECRYLYLPYLHFDSYKAVIKRRNLIKQRLEQGRTHPVPTSVVREESLELRTIWAFLGHDPPINCRRTLDQYQYPSVHDTTARDDDQVLYKLTKERLPNYNLTEEELSYLFTIDDEDVLDGNLLMVDQLWMWILETPDHRSRLVTFYPRRDSSPTEGSVFGQADLRDITYNDLNAGLAQRCETASDLAALTVFHAVTVLIDRSTDPNLDIFRIFEEAVSILTETMTSSLKRFGMSAFSGNQSFQSIEAMKSLSIRDRHRLELERAKEESRNSTSTLLELRDVEDELKSLLDLFGEQQDHIKTLLKISEAKADEDPKASQNAPGASLTSNGRYFLTEALEKLKTYRSQVEDMIDRVQKALRDFDRLLEIVQKQTQLEDGYISRHQADLAKVQNRSVIIFTVFSVVFLPLSFFTSVFGMNTREWGGGDNLSLSTIFSIGVPISVTLIAGTVIAAWVIAEGAGYGTARRWVKKVEGRIVRKMPVSLWERETARNKTKITEQQRREIINPDFWERHRLERNGRYEIPPGNRKSATLARARKMAAEAKENWDVEAGE